MTAPASERVATTRLDQLQTHAWRVRRFALRMGEVQGQGYVGQALGWADVLAVAWCHAMTIRPAEPEWEGRDRFLLARPVVVFDRPRRCWSSLSTRNPSRKRRHARLGS